MAAQTTYTVTMERVRDFEFLVRFGEPDAELIMDEPAPLGGGVGPNAAKALAAALGNCLAASLLFCLQKSRAHVRDARATADVDVARNEQGRLRIGAARVAIQLDADPGDRAKVERCLGLFEDFCIVTQSVRRGIPVEVSVTDPSGALIEAPSRPEA